MFPEDDFLLSKPVRRESATVLRIALMALLGCLALLLVLVIQARAEAGAPLHCPSAAVTTSISGAVAAEAPAPATVGKVNPAC